MLRIRLLIADRRPIVLQGFESLLAAERDFEIVASCSDGAGCLEAIRSLMPDVALVEDGFSDLTASEMLAAVTAEDLPTRLVFYTASVARGDVAAAIAAGACTAIPMHEQPEILLRSLRLVAPNGDRAASRDAGNGALGENGLAALTDLERKIMRLVASGMSNREIARQLGVAPGTITARVDRISAQLEIKNRTELAAFALSRLYGAVGVLAALIWAALDDVQSANASAGHHAPTDGVTVTAVDGTGAVIAIKISPQKAAPAAERTAKAAGKAPRLENSLADMPTRGRELIETRADGAASTIDLPTLTAPRAGLSSFGAFMMMAVGVSIYEFLGSPAQAFPFSDSPGEGFASAAANAGSDAVALNMPGSADANLNGIESLAWLDPEARHESFAFAAGQGDALGRTNELQIIDATASGPSVSDSGKAHVGAGAIDAPIDHGGREQAIAMDGSNHAEHVTVQATAPDGSDDGAQRDLHFSDDGAAGEQHAEHPPGPDPDHGQSPRDLDVSENGTAGQQHANHDSIAHDSDRGPSHREIKTSEEGSAPADQHVKTDVPGSHANSGLSQPDSHKPHLNASKAPQAGPSQNAGGNDQAPDGSDPAERAAARQFEDSFHFKNDMAEVRDSNHSENGHGPDAVEFALHDGGMNGLQAVIQDAEPMSSSHVDQSAPDHARDVAHLAHHLLV